MSAIELNRDPKVTVEFCAEPHSCGGEYFIMETGKDPICVMCAMGQHSHIVLFGWHLTKSPHQLVAFRSAKRPNHT